MNIRLPMLIACALLVASCANGLGRASSDLGPPRYLDYVGEPVRGFSAHRINNWTPLSRTQIVVWTGVNDAYLLTVWDTCPDLQTAHRIGISSTANRVSSFEKVLVDRQECPISEVRSIDVRQMKADRAVERRLLEGKPLEEQAAT
ncbi:MAG TPA: DUF6491 family protein [Pseudomonadales bacterium]|nr:DUF6491 family protein [Pseudomonadales bacterium]